MPKRRITSIKIPEGLTFGALRLSRDPATGDVVFDGAVITRICEANGLDPAVMHEGPEDHIAALITAWYAAHLAAGGEPDPVAEAIGAEVRAEDGYEGLQ